MRLLGAVCIVIFCDLLDVPEGFRISVAFVSRAPGRDEFVDRKDSK